MNTGDYARTKSGIIGKLIIKEDTIAVAKWQGGYELQDTTTYIINDEKVYKNEIIKSSPNIIDLIEVGDVIKYNQVQNHYAKKKTLYKAIKDERDLLFLKYQVQNDKLKILSILTKEQIEQMEYKVGE